ncbi:MAG: ECF transporter S component [Clostridia bacterium]|nr:ECF transporter S component [Clostridia bacterium]
MKNKFTTKQLVILGLLTAVVLILSMTPLGTLPLGPLSITLNMIPVAIAAVTLGPVGGLIIGTVFGLFSFLQAVGMFVPSGLGMITFQISWFGTFVQRVVSRALVGLLCGFIFAAFRKAGHRKTGMFATGFCAALLNFILFMGLLVALFSNAPEVAKIWSGKTVLVYLGATFMSNTIFEVAVTAALTGIIGMGLDKARLIPKD